MKTIAWEQSLAVGFEQLDEQHKRIIYYIKLTTECIQRKDSKLFIQDLLDSLHRHMMDHFETEEKYFKMFGYQGAMEHRRVHADFLIFLKHTIESYKNGGVLNEGDVVLVFTWLVDHIKGVDRMYIGCFKDHGLQ